MTAQNSSTPDLTKRAPNESGLFVDQLRRVADNVDKEDVANLQCFARMRLCPQDGGSI